MPVLNRICVEGFCMFMAVSYFKASARGKALIVLDINRYHVILLTVMRIFMLITILFFESFALGDVIISARIAMPVCDSTGEYIGDKIDTAYKKNFADCFDGINLAELEDAGELGVWGMPVYFVLKTEDDYYGLTMNNEYGVFDLRKVTKNGKIYKYSYKKSMQKTIYAPKLYDKLKAAGINIASLEDMRSAHKLPSSERKKVLESYKIPYKAPDKN